MLSRPLLAASIVGCLWCQISRASEPRPFPTPAKAAPATAADRSRHLLKAADHLEAAGLAEQAAHFRKQADEERKALRDRLDRKLAELEQIRSEIDELRRQIGAPRQIRLKLQILEVDLSHHRLAEIRKRLPALEQPAEAGEGISGILRAAAEVPAMVSRRSAPAGTQSARRLAETIALLRSEGVLKIVAEPELVTPDGRPAHLLSGGEFPVPVPQPDGTHKLEWREFGVRMEAVAHAIGGERIRLEIDASVADRDYSNCVRVHGLDVPGLDMTRMNTRLELRLGQPTVLGGLSVRSEGENAGETRAVETVMIVTPETVTPMIVTPEADGPAS